MYVLLRYFPPAAAVPPPTLCRILSPPAALFPFLPLLTPPVPVRLGSARPSASTPPQHRPRRRCDPRLRLRSLSPPPVFVLRRALGSKYPARAAPVAAALDGGVGGGGGVWGGVGECGGAVVAGAATGPTSGLPGHPVVIERVEGAPPRMGGHALSRASSRVRLRGVDCAVRLSSWSWRRRRCCCGGWERP